MGIACNDDNAVELNMKLPEIDDTITTDDAIKLCVHFGFDHLAKRIQDNRSLYKPWLFDGASMVPDELASKVLDIPHLTKIALKHDLSYAYGEPGNDAERKLADEAFRDGLLADGASTIVAELMYAAVRAGGGGAMKTGFSWGFARK